MNLYDKASLILTPNAYKASKMYSIKPSLQSTLLTIGDSLTNDGGYQRRIVYNQSNIWGFLNKGISGNNTTQMLARFSTDILANANSGEYVVIWGGINDLAQDVPLATIQSNLQSMYTQAKAAGLIVIANNISPWKGSAFWTSGRQAQQDLLNAWIASTAIDIDYKIDVFSALEDPSVPDTLLPAYNSGDSIHYSVAGYNAVGDAICASVTFLPTTQEPSGAGDLTLTRSTVASRRNSSGKWESVAINIPRLHYPIGGGCPMWLQEPQRTSEFGRSMWTGGGSTPTGWSKFGSGTTAVGPTTSFFETSEGVVTYSFTCSTNIAFFFNSLAVTSGTTYTLSVFIESASGLNYSDILTITGAGYSSNIYMMNGVVVSAASPIVGTGRLELIATCNSSGTSVFRIGAGTQGSNLTANCTLSLPQLEVGECASSPIITNAGATTRTADVQNTTVKPMIGQTEGTLFVEFSQQILKGNDVIQLNRSVTNTVYIGTDSSGNIVVYIYASSSAVSYNTNVKVTPNGVFKVAIGYKSGNNYVSVNGVGFAFSNTFTFNGDLASINTFRSPYLLGVIPTNYGDVITYLTRLTNAELNALTA
jgi:lysophospholipase L1-like esterase